MIIKKTKKNKGFVLLFAVVISSIVLAITMGVINIALKEANFSTSGKNTNDAFFAADTGVECALFYDRDIGILDAFPSSTITPMVCAGNEINVSDDGSSGGLFSVFNLGSSGNSCAFVTITKDIDNNKTTIISKGYNVFDSDEAGNGNCVPTSSSIERQLEVNY